MKSLAFRNLRPQYLNTLLQIHQPGFETCFCKTYDCGLVQFFYNTARYYQAYYGPQAVCPLLACYHLLLAIKVGVYEFLASGLVLPPKFIFLLWSLQDLAGEYSWALYWFPVLGFPGLASSSCWNPGYFIIFSVLERENASCSGESAWDIYFAKDQVLIYQIPCLVGRNVIDKIILLWRSELGGLFLNRTGLVKVLKARLVIALRTKCALT